MFAFDTTLIHLNIFDIKHYQLSVELNRRSKYVPPYHNLRDIVEKKLAVLSVLLLPGWKKVIQNSQEIVRRGYKHIMCFKKEMEEDHFHTRNSEVFKCNICDKTFSDKSQFMKHRKTKHVEMVKSCKNGECIYKNECWFRHDFEDIKEDNIKANENEKLIEKLVGLVEKLNERVSNLETPEKIL